MLLITGNLSFTMVEKNNRPFIREDRTLKNRRYLAKSARYQIGGDRTKLGGASTKICEAKSIFYFCILFSSKGKSVINSARAMNSSRGRHGSLAI